MTREGSDILRRVIPRFATKEQGANCLLVGHSGQLFDQESEFDSPISMGQFHGWAWSRVIAQTAGGRIGMASVCRW